MYLKRASFRRGGATGIAQLSSNRQMYAGGGNIGGGIFTGSNLGSRTGFKTIKPAFVNRGGGQPVKPELTKMDKAKNILKRGTSISVSYTHLTLPTILRV